MNYTELVQSIQDFTENNETTFVAEIPTFVRQTEELIHRTVMIQNLEKNATANVTASNPYIARPNDFLAPFSFTVVDSSNNYNFLIRKLTLCVKRTQIKQLLGYQNTIQSLMGILLLLTPQVILL